MNDERFVVFLVDADRCALKALTRLLGSKGYEVRGFASARDFLAEHDPSVSGCVVCDYCLPDIDGLGLQAELAARAAGRPLIFVSNIAELEIGVTAMKAGAIDFLKKPARADDLLAAIALAHDKEMRSRQRRMETESVHSRLERLTPREKQVLGGVVTGMLNKQIAYELGLVEKTVKVHRGHMMQKMAVRSVAELVRLSERAGLSMAEVRFG